MLLGRRDPDAALALEDVSLNLIEVDPLPGLVLLAVLGAGLLDPAADEQLCGAGRGRSLGERCHDGLSGAISELDRTAYPTPVPAGGRCEPTL